MAADTIRFIVTVAIVVYKGLIPVVGRMLTDNLAKFEEQASGKTAKFEDFVPPIGGVKGEA